MNKSKKSKAVLEYEAVMLRDKHKLEEYRRRIRLRQAKAPYKPHELDCLRGYMQ